MSLYKDRIDAGNCLADELSEYYEQQNTIILALPRGGVPIAYQLALKLHLPMTVILVRKLGVPGNKEFAMGAITENNTYFLNEKTIRQIGVTPEEIQQTITEETQELQRRIMRYRGGESLPNLKGKNIIVVDDGIATGATVKVVVRYLKTLHPNKIIIAVPVASQESISELSLMVDKIVCPLIPDMFYAVGQWYQSFSQVSEEEVITFLKLVDNKYI